VAAFALPPAPLRPRPGPLALGRGGRARATDEPAENHTPKTGWREGDGPENHYYSATAPEPEPLDDGVVPPLVLRASQMGLDI
jgi:hypothetical protein